MTQVELQKKFKIDEECLDQRTVVSENKSTFELDIKDLRKQGEDFYCIRIDDCLIKSSEMMKCDFVFHRCETDDFYFVELKGSEIDKAYKQLVETLRKHIPTERENCLGFIVPARIPSSGTDINKLKFEFRKKDGRALFIKNGRCIFKPSEESLR
jgi:hypothetical protein